MVHLGSNNQVLLIEIAQECNVSVRDIHFAAKELKTELQPTARSVDGKFAKVLIKYFIDKQQKEEKIEEVKKKESKKVEKKVKKIIKKSTDTSNKIIIEKQSDLDKTKKKDLKTRPKKTEKFVKIVFQPKIIETPRDTKPKKTDKGRFEKVKFQANTNKIKKTIQRPKVNTEVSDELLGLNDANKPKDTVEIYDEMIAQEREKEIVHSQRKQMAGKVNAKPAFKKQATIGHTIKYDPDRVIEVPDVISVKEFAEKSGLGAAKIIGELMKNGILANINQIIDFDSISIIADDLNVRIKRKQSEASAEDIFKGNLNSLVEEHDKSMLEKRPPIVVVMGHVDHGKTKLLDAIRHTDVVSAEVGGITQHIGAYQVEKNGKKITFIDTPGHEAFTAMRARGAKVTDVVVLVVAADEGVKPQTLEALQHAKAAHVPIIVAINKIDKPNADVDKVKGELAAEDLVPEDWGGKTIMTSVSAVTKQGIDELLDMILLVSDMSELKANPNRPAVATVIEANLDSSLGPVATVIISTGTLKVMDNVIVGESYGRIKLLKNYYGKSIKLAYPSTPVLIAGLSSKVESGDILQVVPDEKTARQKAIAVKSLRLVQQKERGLGEIMSAINAGKSNTLKIVLKTDTNGSLEAIKQSIGEIKNENVSVKIILSGVGSVTESDVMMAAASGAIVMGFNCKVSTNVNALAERENVEVIKYNIIYKMLDDIKKILTGLLEPEYIEIILGELNVQKIFYSKKKEAIIGCSVISGKVENKVKFKVKRGGEEVGDGQITSLQKNQDQVNEVKEGCDCGLKVNCQIKIDLGDVIEVFKVEKKMRTL